MSEVILETIAIQERANDLFLQELIEHLCLEVPTFDGEFFLERLHIRQSLLPTERTPVPGGPKIPDDRLLRMWERKVVLTEKAIEAARKTPKLR